MSNLIRCSGADGCLGNCMHKDPHTEDLSCSIRCMGHNCVEYKPEVAEEEETKEPSVGFVIGRFQIDELHEGHLALFDHAIRESVQVIALIGRTCLRSVHGYALDFQSVAHMIRETYPEVMCLPLDNRPDNASWSADVDSIVSSIVMPGVSAKLYGGRDSFIPHYEGRYDCVEVPEVSDVSATARRKEIAADYVLTGEGRKGMILATARSWVRFNAKMCVDIIAWRGGYRDQFLVGWKKDDPRLRLPGGFVDDGETLEDAVKREAREEFQCDVSTLRYVGSFVVDDWRYRSIGQHITTAAFQCHMDNTQEIVAGDDLAGVKRVSVDWFLENEDKFIPSHARIIRKACAQNGSIRP